MNCITLPVTCSLLLLCGCVAPVQTVSATASAPLGWLVGCWQTADDATVERWTAAADTHLFGSNVSYQHGVVVFFEQMRIEPGPDGPVFQAYPRGVGPSSFAAIAQEKQSITFANAQHDYPQKITYQRQGQVLTANISLMDNSKPGEWQFTPCD